MHVLANVSSKDRYFTTLPQALLGIALQTRPPDRLVVFEDGEHKDLRGVPVYDTIFQLMSRKGIQWEVLFARREGQHKNHQIAQEMATDLIWRIDDDAVPEANVLEGLVRHFIDPKVGAVGGLVLVPSMPLDMPDKFVSGRIQDVKWAHNPQWYPHPPTVGPMELDHLHCSFLYRKTQVSYDMSLSPVAHREETLFTHELKRAGYKILLDPSYVTWHLRQPEGGIRSYQDPAMYAHDEMIFDNALKRWGVTSSAPPPLVVLDCGIGDHLAFLERSFPLLKAKYGQSLTVAVCYPDLFKDKDTTIISIGQAGAFCGSIDQYNVYRFMDESKWDKPLADAFVALYQKLGML